MKINSSLRLLTVGALLSTNLYAGSSDVELNSATVDIETDNGRTQTVLNLNYKFNSIADGVNCIAVVKMDRIRDSINDDTPKTVPTIRVSNFLWDESDVDESGYDEELIGYPKKGKDTESSNGILRNCKNLDPDAEEVGHEQNYHGLLAKYRSSHLRNTDNNADNTIQTISISDTVLSLSTWSATGVPSYTSFTPNEKDYTATDDNGNFVEIDDSLVITTAILRRNNNKTKEFYHFESWVDLGTGVVTNLPIGLDMETWHYPGYDISPADPLPALITFNDQNQPGCLAQLNGSNKYECLWPADGDIQGAFPSSIGDISNTDDFRVLSCGEAEEDGIESPSGIYDVVSHEAEHGSTGYHTSSHWCLRVDKTYRSWHNLISATGQGWVAAKDGMGDWWCIRDGDRICKNSLIEDVIIPEDQDLAAKMSVLASPMADTSLTSCRFNDGSISACSANDYSAFDSSVTFDTLKKAFFIDAANLLDLEEPAQ